MMMKVGKILVLVNVAFAVGAAIWALGLYLTNQAAATAAAAKQPQAAAKSNNRLLAELDERKSRADALQKALQESRARWKGAHASLVRLEQIYYANPVWFRDRLEELDKGLKAPQGGHDVNADMLQVAKRNGLVVPDEQGRPMMEPARDFNNQPVKAVAFFRPRIDEAVQLLQTLSADLIKASEEAAAITLELAGTDKVKGLRTRLEDEVAKIKRLKEESDDLKDVLTKQDVDSELLVRRQIQMEKRVKELEKFISTPATKE